jgi:hypothetical protein
MLRKPKDARKHGETIADRADEVAMLARRVKVLEKELARVIIAQFKDEALGGTNAVKPRTQRSLRRRPPAR